VATHAEPGEKRPYKKKVLNNKPKQISEGMMTNKTTENFLKVMAEFEWPDPVPVTYRLYYNEDGSPKCYTMESLPGKYIELDRETYVLSPWNVRVINETLHIIPPAITVKKLQPSNTNGTSCHPQDICVVVSADQNHTKWKLSVNETH
jgi:hypothetical protein